MIYGKDVDTRLQTFGWSLSGGMDLDGNEYPDVLVGAYESANAVYMRSAPVVHLTSKVIRPNYSFTRPYLLMKNIIVSSYAVHIPFHILSRSSFAFRVNRLTWKQKTADYVTGNEFHV